MNEPPFRIAPLGAADLQRYRRLMLEAYAAAPDAFSSTAEERAAEPDAWWLQRIADPAGRSLAWGAFDGDELVGTVALELATKPKTRHKATLIGMYVQPGARGSGLGRRLATEALRHARALPQLTTLTLTVTLGNAAAEALYHALGFRSFGVEPQALRAGGAYLAKRHMWLPLHGENDPA